MTRCMYVFVKWSLSMHYSHPVETNKLEVSHSMLIALSHTLNLPHFEATLYYRRFSSDEFWTSLKSLVRHSVVTSCSLALPKRKSWTIFGVQIDWIFSTRIILPHHYAWHKMRSIATDFVAWSVSLLDTTVRLEPCKNGWTDRGADGVWTRVGLSPVPST